MLWILQLAHFGERFRTGLDAFVRQRTVHAGEILLGPNYLLLCPRHLPLGAQFQKPLVVHVIGRLTPLQVKIDDGAHARLGTESGKNTAQATRWTVTVVRGEGLPR